MMISWTEKRFFIAGLTKKASYFPSVLLLGVFSYITVNLMVDEYYYGTCSYVWQYLYLPVPPWKDLKLITSAFDCYRNGVDVLYSCPCDIEGRPFNYPKLWLLLASTGIAEKHTELTGVILTGLFILVVLLFLGRLNLMQFLIYLCVICSSSFMHGVVAGNSDVFIFSLLCLFLILGRSKNDLAALFSGIICLLASYLKLFPVLSLSYYLREKPKIFFVKVIGLSIFFFVYLLLYQKDILRVFEVTPRFYVASYGAFVFFDRVVSSGPNDMVVVDEYKIFHAVIIGIAAGIMIGSSLKIFKTARLTWNTESVHIDGFRVGASIYVGTFLMGNNFDYRLMFLLFTLPQMIEWATSSGRSRNITIAAICMVILRLWGTAWDDKFSSPGVVNAFKSLLEWFLFAYYFNAFILTLPVWVRARLKIGGNLPETG